MTEKLSALFDGHLDDGDAATRPLFDALRQDRVLREKWGTYCLIGDALRGEAKGPDLVGRVLSRLDGEPTVLAPTVRPRAAARPSRLGRVVLPVAASVMGVTAVGWVVQSMQPTSGPVDVAAKPSGRAEGMVAAAAPASTPEDPLRSYVFAHQALAGGSPIPGIAQFVRTVTEVRQGSDR